ncbi:MAG: ABC transporter permease [Thermofilum sp. ex4484_82]|nr:MAG: ABC transporter permease [Thermofilum sp. ex4484_82]OYT39683.1 MAG: ABC transporter permease [Archaeoglobales archaeon ex4484_92]
MRVPPYIKYLGKRFITVGITLIIAVYLTILIANMGGYVDEIIKSDLLFTISTAIRQNPAYKGLPEEQIQKLINETYYNELKRLGFDKPFIYRSFEYLRRALTLDLGRSLYITSNTGSRFVRTIILERLPVTVLLFTTTNVLLFFIGLFGGLYLSRKYGATIDKIAVSLAPLSSIPGWFYGVFLIIIFASYLHLLPYGGIVDAPPPEDPLSYALSVLKHMILPVTSWLIAYSAIGIYVRRTFFLMFSSEDYVEVAKAKGLPEKLIERRYILRPTLPPIITDFSLTLIASWMGAIVTETIFNWSGIGLLFYDAAMRFDAPVVIGLVVIYAYLLAITIIILDVVYVIVDPRIRLGAM